MTIRSAALAIVLFAAAVGYVLLLHRSPAWDFPQERRFESAGGEAAAVHVYIEPISVNAVAESMQIRVSIVSTKSGKDAPAIPDRDFSLALDHDDTADRIEIRANQPAPVTTIDLDLNDGDVSGYPLDAYRAGLWVRCFEKSATSDAQPVPLPIDVTVWQRVLGFRAIAGEQEGGPPGGRHLTFEIRRSFAVAFFALAAYGAMVVLACAALTIGALVFVGVRRPEATLMGAVAGIVFALPALRNALPGGAPLGVAGDIFVFLWAELAAALAIALLVLTWVRTGPRP
jgi:hypothetical protein